MCLGGLDQETDTEGGESRRTRSEISKFGALFILSCVGCSFFILPPVVGENRKFGG